jgi:hypothetical protein
MQTDDVAARIAYEAPRYVRDVISSLGQTEDVRFSPSNRRLAVAGLLKNKIGVFDISVTRSGNSKSITLTNAREISSSYLQLPHGVDFIDDEKILVANRGGQPCIFDLTSVAPGGNTEMAPLAVIRSEKIATPGSVRVVKKRRGLYEALICNNSGNTVTRHLLNLDAGCATTSSEVLLKKRLNCPDSICLNNEMQWFAVSSHFSHTVLLFENAPALNESSEPDGILRCSYYPHGLRFTSDGRFILVADADALYVHIYERDDAGWRGVRNPLSSFRVLNDDEYLRGRYAPGEGGPKGIDINDAMNILVTTCGEQPLAFFDLPAVLESASSRKSVQGTLDQRALELKYELDLHDELDLLNDQSYRNSRSWRITAPLRWIFSVLRKLTGKSF